jgi:hypothetical protein
LPASRKEARALKSRRDRFREKTKTRSFRLRLSD